MESKRFNTTSDEHLLSSLPNPSLLPFSRYYPTHKIKSIEHFVTEFSDFKKEFMQAFYFQDGPKLRYLIHSLKQATMSMRLTELREKCVELDLRLEQGYAIERTLIKRLLQSFEAAMKIANKPVNNETTLLN